MSIAEVFYLHWGKMLATLIVHCLAISLFCFIMHLRKP